MRSTLRCRQWCASFFVFFFNATPPPEIYTLSLHDALPILSGPTFRVPVHKLHRMAPRLKRAAAELAAVWPHEVTARDFGLGVRVRTDNGRPRAPRRHA